MNTESLTHLSKILWQQLSAQFPKWQRYAETVEVEYETNGADNQRLYVRVASPADEKCYLSVLERGDCIEISFSDGKPPGGAEAQIICDGGAEDSGVEAAIEFIQKIVDERIVIGRGRSLWFTGFIPSSPSFMEADEVEGKRKKLVSVRSWKGNYNWDVARSK